MIYRVINSCGTQTHMITLDYYMISVFTFFADYITSVIIPTHELTWWSVTVSVCDILTHRDFPH